MSVPADQKFSGFVDGGTLVHDDIVVGLRNGVNTRFSYQGDPGIYLPLAGGTMVGAIIMDSNVITDLPAPTNPSDAATKAYVDSMVGAYLPLAGGTMSGSINMGNQFISNMAGIKGANSNLVAQFTDRASSVNYLEFFSSLTGAPALIDATGSDSAVTLNLRSKGGDFWLSDSTGTRAPSLLLFANDGLHGVGFKAPATLVSSFVWTLPSVDGSSGYVMTTDGSGVLSFQANAASTPHALTKTDDTNVTLALGGTPATALLQAVSLTLGWTGTLAATRGGTGTGTYTLGDTLYSSAANTLSKLSGNTTTAKQYLSQTGDGVNSAAPVWATISGSDITGAALTKADDTNVTMTLGGTPTTALLRAASMTLGWTGQLSVARGGTGLAAITAHYIPIGNGTSALTLLAPSATSGLPLISQGASADPAYGTAVVAGGGTGNTTFTAYSLICAGTTATGAFQNVSGVGSLNQVLVSQGAGALPIWSSVPGVTPAALTKADDTNVTLTLGGTPSTALLQATSITAGWTGQLAVSRGGSGAGTLTGLLTGNGTSAFTATAITQYNVLTGGASNAPNSVAPSATSGVPLISQGAASQPVFGTAVVAGGGTGLTAITAHYLPIGNGTGALTLLAPSATSGVPLISQGASSDPAYGTAVVAGGGTGLTSATAYAVLCGGTTTTGAFQSVAALGAAGTVLTSNGAGALPTFQAISGTGTVTSVATSGLATGGTITTTGTITVTAAVQSDMETDTSTTTAVTPAVMKYSPGVAKFYCNKVGNSTTINRSYNVSSTTHASTGTHVINFTTSFSDTSYVTNANSLISATLQYCIVQSQATGSVSINTYNSSGTLTDPTQLLAAGHGDF